MYGVATEEFLGIACLYLSADIHFFRLWTNFNLMKKHLQLEYQCEILCVCCLDMYLSTCIKISLDVEFLKFVGKFKRNEICTYFLCIIIFQHAFEKYHIYHYKEMK